MKINWKLVEYDMLDDIHLPNCPSMFRTQAEQIIKIISGMQPVSYNKVSTFDRHLIVEVWKSDGLDQALENPESFRKWYLSHATEPDLITRARRWLMEHNYLISSPSIAERAQESSEKWKAGIK